MAAARAVPAGEQLRAGLLSAKGLAAATLVVVAVALVWEPWTSDGVTRESDFESEQTWLPLSLYLGEAVPVPEAAAVPDPQRPDHLDSRRLVESAVSTYEKSTGFYDTAAKKPPRGSRSGARGGWRPSPCWFRTGTNDIGMDRVARAVGDRAGATVVLDAGDDASTRQPSEAFSLDSVSEAFRRLRPFAVAAATTPGDFVADYFDGLGCDNPRQCRPVEGPDDDRSIGIADPRSSGLGDWRDESGYSFTEVGERFSEAVCDAEDRVATVLVHDVNLARLALAQGCADLVVGGHVHVKIGPTQLRGTTARSATPTRPARPACGVRHRDRRRAAPRCHRLAHHLPRRSPPASRQ